MDLYYDPVVDEHVSSPMGLIAPVWYLAPQRREVAESAWTMVATPTGPLGCAERSRLQDPTLAPLPASHTLDFVDGEVMARPWVHLGQFFHPSWDHDLGWFTSGFVHHQLPLPSSFSFSLKPKTRFFSSGFYSRSKSLNF